MLILHVARISNSLYDGVCVAVPQHIRAQKKYADVALFNVANIEINGIDTQFQYSEHPDISTLPEPFCKPELVVFHGIYIYHYIKLAKQLRKIKIPYIINPHGSLTVEAQSKKRLKKLVANILLFNRFINGAKAIQCLSQKEMEAIRFKNKKFIGTNGISIPEKRKTSFRDNNIHITYIGRLEEYVKGFDLMLSAVKAVKTELSRSNIIINIFGPDHMGRYANIERLITENGVGDIVTLNPAVTGKEKEDILLDTDIFIQTSRTEGMPMGILEALSYGIPCLITEGTRLGEFVRNNNAGWVCETNAEAISQALIKAISEIDTLQLKSQNARKAVEENFSWDIIAQETVNNYRRLI